MNDPRGSLTTYSGPRTAQPRAVSIVCRDPGATNIILPIATLIESMGVQVALFLRDHAAKRGADLGLAFSSISPETVTSCLPHCDAVITGTSHRDDCTEQTVWLWAKERGIRSIAIVDQTIRVLERFSTLDGEVCAPEVIVVPRGTDPHVLHTLRSVAPTVLILPNPYLSDLVVGREKYRESRAKMRAALGARENECVIVYASEPQRLLSRQGVNYEDVHYDEHEALTTIIHSLNRVTRALRHVAPHLSVHVRQHPKEHPQNYATIIPELRRELTGITLSLPPQRHPSIELAVGADLIVGMKTTLLTESALLGTPALSLDLWNLPHERPLGWGHEIAGVTSPDELDQWLHTFLSPEATPAIPQTTPLSETLSPTWRQEWQTAVRETFLSPT